jgi:hypothetical protein
MASNLPYPNRKVIRVTPTLDTSAYATGDVLFNSVEIPNAVFANGGCSKLINMYVVNQNTAIIDVNFFFSENSMTLGTINATADIADADVEAGKILGTMKLDGDQSQTGGIDTAHVSMVFDAGGAGESGNPLLLQAAANSTSVYVAGIITSGTPTFAADDLDLVFHIEY